MTKTKAASIKPTKPRRKRSPHLFETPQFKERLKRSIEKNSQEFISDRDDFIFRHNIVQLLAPCKKTRGKRGRITRPQNAFILYRKDFQDEVKQQYPDANFEKISQIVGKLWAKESDIIKNRYTLLAALCSRVHNDLFPNYKFRPRPKEGEEKGLNNMAEESKGENRRGLPWYSYSSIIAPPQMQPSLEEQMFTLSVNDPQESYEIANISHTIESQSLMDLFDLIQQNEQFVDNNFINHDCFNYEMQPVETLPFNFSENASIDTTLTLPFVHTTMAQEFYPSMVFPIEPIEYNFDQGTEQLYNIFEHFMM